MLVDHVLESQSAGLLESVLMPFDIYNDSAQHALVYLKQRFLYDEIEAEVKTTSGLSFANMNVYIFLQISTLSIEINKGQLNNPLGSFLILIGGPLF